MSQSVNDPMHIVFDKEKKEKLIKAYKEALSNKQETFMFEGEATLTDYAKYLIEYLEAHLD